jgi:hypothetical protein
MDTHIQLKQIYKIWMDKHIQVKYKIQNVDGQTHTYETKNTKFGWTNTYK